MTSPHPSESHPSASARSSSANSQRPPSAWSAGAPANTSQASSRRGLAPIATSAASSGPRPGSSSQSPRNNPWSPSVAPSNPPPTASSTGPRQQTRSSSISTGTSPFSPPPGQQPTSAFSSNRNRTATTAGAQHPSSTLAASVSRAPRGSPSVSQSGFGSPPGTSGGASTSGQSGSLARIVIAQIFLLLSTLKEEDKAKWESQVDQIKKLVDSNGMEVFSKYFHRLLLTNAPFIFSGGRKADNNYQILVAEVHRISQDASQADKIAEAIDGAGDGDIFRDFDLSGFMEHFKLKALPKVALASAFKKATKSDLRTKADAILSNNLQTFFANLATPSLGDGIVEDLSTAVIVAVIDRLAQYPPRNWSPEAAASLSEAIERRYQAIGSLVPTELSSTLMLFDLLAPNNTLVRLLQRHGPRATERVEKCKAILEQVELQDINFQQVASVILFMVIARDDPAYNPSIFVAALREHRGGQRLDWQDVIHSLDREGITITKAQFKGIFDALLPLAQEYENFDLQLLWGGEWHHGETQLAFTIAFLSFSQDELDAATIPRLRTAFSVEDFQDAPKEVQAYAAQSVHHPFVSLDATRALFNLVFRSSDTYAHASNLGVIEHVINPRMDIFVCSVSAISKPWGALQDQAMKQLVQPFFLRNAANHRFVFHLLWKRDDLWLAGRLKQFYQQQPTQLRLVFEHAQDHGWLESLIGLNNELSLDLAAYAHGQGLFDILQWLEQLTQTVASPRVLAALSQFLASRAKDDLATQRDRQAMTTVPLAIKTVHVMLTFLGDVGLPEDDLISLQRECICAYPRLINYGEGYDEIIDANNADGNSLPPETDATMQQQYKEMYAGECQVRDVIERLQQLKTSQDPHEQDLFICMIFGLFDEYNCFGQYPREALATTAVLFGSIINFDLLSRIALKAALAMVLEAVRDFPPEAPMHKFGLQALMHFQDRLSEWRLFTERLQQVPGLRGSQIQPALDRVADEPESTANGGANDANENNVDSFLANDSRPAAFTCLSVEPTSRIDFFQEPSTEAQELVLFALNNVSERNLTEKQKDIANNLSEKNHQWFANYLVEKLIKDQPNFHQVYMDLVDKFDNQLLWSEVTRETYVYSFRLLNSESTLSSASERTALKNMADWIGAITLARNKPIKHRNIAFRELLVEAHAMNRLALAIPFTCRILTKAVNSSIFMPPCAWTVEILEVLVELHRFMELKVQQKFEIERLCNDLKVEFKDIEPAEAVRSQAIQEEQSLSNVPGEAIEAFGDLNIMGYRKGLMERLSPKDVVPDMNHVAPLLKHNYTISSGNPALQNQLRQIMTQAVERAINEIIEPVVERSVTIAAISAFQLITKDFALEPDAGRLEKAAHNSVRHLAGSLALVTCKEPLRSSIQTNIRALVAREIGDQTNFNEGAILMFVNDNLEMVCGLIEKAAETASVQEIDAQLEGAVQNRKNGQFVEGNVNRWAFQVPEPFKPVHGGLNSEQMAIYENFGRTVRASPSHAINMSQDGLRQVPDVLQDQFGAMGNIQSTADQSSVLRQNSQHPPPGHLMSTPNRQSQQMVNGFPDAQSFAERTQSLVSDIVKAATEAAEESSQRDLMHVHAVVQSWHRLEGLIRQSGQAAQQDSVAMTAADNVCRMLYSEQSPPAVVDLLARVLRMLCDVSEATLREVCMFIRASEDRLYNPITTSALLKCGLLDYALVDRLTTMALMSHSPEGLAFFSEVIDRVLLDDPPAALRAEFATSMAALAEWLAAEPDLYPAQDVLKKLRDVPAIPDAPLALSGAAKGAQATYLFEEWVKLQGNQPSPVVLTSFIQQLHTNHVISTRDETTAFFRACIDASVGAFNSAVSISGPGVERAYIPIDSLAKLVMLIVSAQAQTQDDGKMDKTAHFRNFTTTAVFVLAHHYRFKGEHFCQRVFFRLFASIICEMSVSSTIMINEQADMMFVMAESLILLKPQLFPGFAFAWLDLISHRLFLPVLMRTISSRGWSVYCELLVIHVRYVGDIMKSVDASRSSRDLYRGTMELILVLHHDFPDFLAENHYQLLNSIPQHFIQMRSLVISASPSTLSELPDPFTSGPDLDRLDENRRLPTIRAQLGEKLEEGGIKQVLDNLVESRAGGETPLDQICMVLNDPSQAFGRGAFQSAVAEDALFNDLVLYLLERAVYENSSPQSGPADLVFHPDGRIVHVLDSLTERLSPAARFQLLGALANQLRFPNAHTQYVGALLLHLFRSRPVEHTSLDIQLQITRVMLERLLAGRPHPWGLIKTFLELLKNRQYHFWDLPFIKGAPELERVCQSILGSNQRV